MIAIFRLFNNRKGTIQDLQPIMVFGVVFSIIILFSFAVLTLMNSSGAFSQTTQGQAIITHTIDNFGIWDNLFIAAIIGFSLSSIIAAAFVRSSPLFLVLSIIFLAITLVLGKMAQNVFLGMTSSGAISRATMIGTFPKIFFVMDNLLIYLLVMGAFIVIALYSVRGESAF